MSIKSTKDKLFENYINILKHILKVNENYKDASTFQWNIGTDWFLNIARWSSIFDYISDKYDHGNNESIVLSLPKVSEVKAKNGMQSRHKILIEKYIYENGALKDKISLGFASFPKSNENKYNFSFDIENQKEMSYSAFRQFRDIGCSLGFITIHNKKMNEKWEITNHSYRKLIDTSDERKVIISVLNDIHSYMDNLFDLAYSFTNSLRDILFSIFTSWIQSHLLSENKTFTSFLLENNINKFPLRERKSIAIYITDNEDAFIKSSEKNIDTQTIFKKYKDDENILLLIERISSLFMDKYLRDDFEVSYYTQAGKQIQMHIWNQKGRPGQVIYRQSLINAFKRIKANKGLHDILDYVNDEDAVTACHIKDYRYCNTDEEKYDPENGLLLDSNTHKYYDRDIIAIDDNGQLYIRNDKIDSVNKIIPDIVKKKFVRQNIINGKTIQYIKERNELHKIDFNNYVIA